MGDSRLLTDQSFDAEYRKEVQKHSFIHWTPIEIIETAIDWLKLDSESRVLDIGSGAGKFCVVGSKRSKAHFIGVEKREELIVAARDIATKHSATNVTFVHKDIAEVDFSDFTHFYYYNPFCEYIAEFDRIDDSITYDPDSFRRYEDYVINSFDRLPVGTRVVTYCSGTFPFPESYELRDLLYDGKLALFVKVS